MARVRRALLVLVASLAFAIAGEASAAEVLSQDGQGRTIRFDVRAQGVDAEWYATLLRAAPHGDEIATVEIDIVSWDEVRSTCGAEAGGCYSRNVMVVPAEQSDETAHTLVHEYGHHLDRSTPVAGITEPNGMPEWWRARAMSELVRLGSVARSYALGWNRSIAEIFAEDYAQLALADGRYGINWLTAPDATVLAALNADFGLGPPPAIVNPPAVKPLEISKRGSLAPARRAAIVFGLLAPGRRVTATATFRGAAEKRPRARLEIRCDNARVALKTISKGKTSVTIDRRDLGPGDCTATLTNTSSSSRAYTLRVAVTIPAIGV
ncbi:MAG: hypothetical protein QOJ43_1270 [Gaiellaceae bacterium]|nr:hypothetical protein [Gaiellaceae bacterium]